MHLSRQGFYVPKVVLCITIWVYLVSTGIHSKEDAQKVLGWMRWAGYLLCGGYLAYFTILTSQVLKLTPNMKKSYRILVYTTLITTMSSLILLSLNG